MTREELQALLLALMAGIPSFILRDENKRKAMQATHDAIASDPAVMDGIYAEYAKQ